MSSCRPEGQGLCSLYICSPKCVPLQRGQLPVSVRSVDVLRPGPSAASASSGASSKAMATRAWGRGTSSVVTSATFLLPEHLTPVERSPTPLAGAASPFLSPPPSQSPVGDTCLHRSDLSSLGPEKLLTCPSRAVSSQPLSKCVRGLLISDWQGHPWRNSAVK